MITDERKSISDLNVWILKDFLSGRSNLTVKNYLSQANKQWRLFNLSEATRRRGIRSWLVDPYLQVRLGLFFIVINLIFAALTLATFLYYSWDMYVSIASYYELTSSQSTVAFEKFKTPVMIFGSLTLAFVIITLVVSIRYTHRIYGPLVSIHRYLDGLLAGEKPATLKLRESDQLKELAEKLNSLAARLD